MARKANQVTLTFAGDSDKLERSFDRVGASAKEMSGEVGSASRNMASETSDGFGRAGQAADDLDQRAMGFRDTLTGATDTMKGLGEVARGNLAGGLLTLGMGVGDLASGFSNFLIPALKNATKAKIATAASSVRARVASAAHRVAMVATTAATKAMTVAQRALNVVMRANPIGIVITLITALVAAVILAWKNSETFRNIVTGAWQAIKTTAVAVFDFLKGFISGAFNTYKSIVSTVVGTIKSVVSAGFGLVRDYIVSPIRSAKDTIGDLISGILGFFRDIPSKISSAFSTLGDAIKAPFTSAFDAIRSLWNSTAGGFGFSIPSWVPGIGGNDFRIPTMHTGGIVPGAPGQESLAVLQAGEKVTPANQVTEHRDTPDEFTASVTLDLGEGIQRVVDIKLKRHDRALKSRALAGTGVA